MSGSGASPFARAPLSSKTRNRSTTGSPNHRAVKKPKSPARIPTTIPRTRRLLVIQRSILGRVAVRESGLVAREAEKVAAIMHEFMNHPAVDKESGTLLSSDEVNGQERQKAAEHRPRQNLRQG